MAQRFTLATPPHFSFRAAVTGHGWYALAPFVLDRKAWTLDYVFGGDAPFAVRLSETTGGVGVETSRELSEAEASAMLASLRHVLRIDDDLEKFYRLAGRVKRLKWVAEKGAGRLMRSPNVFEDLVKTLCTTNCSWALTKIMVANLVAKLGAGTPDGRRAFPTAAAMASMDERFYRDEIRAGYRAPFFVELAGRVAGGELDPEAWLVSDKATSELKKEIKGVKGCGDYAAENMLKLLGRYDGLALDSWLRGNFYKTYHAGEKCDDKAIAAHYERFAEWRGLAIWCDMCGDQLLVDG